MEYFKVVTVNDNGTTKVLDQLFTSQEEASKHALDMSSRTVTAMVVKSIQDFKNGELEAFYGPVNRNSGKIAEV